MVITAAQLRALCSPPASARRRGIYDGYVRALSSAQGHAIIAAAGIDEHLELVHFLAQIAHECRGFAIIEEDLEHYSPERILVIFGKKHSAKIGAMEAKYLSGKAADLAERAYGLGNPKKARELGNVRAGDGFRYRGRGLIQLTGRDSYRRCGIAIDLPLEDNPDLLAEPLVALKAACWEWAEKRCDVWARRDNLEMVTRLINGGQNGIEDRRRLLAKAKQIWTVESGAVEGEAPDERLWPGASGPRVMELQQRLTELGYPLGSVDGTLGPVTVHALVAFQYDNRLEPTGMVDERVWAALETARPRAAPAPQASEESLRAKGSTEIADADRLAQAVKFGAAPAAAAKAAEEAGLVEQMQTAAEQAGALKMLLTTGAEVMAFASRHLTLVVLVGLVVWGLWLARRMRQRRVAQARAGINIGR